MRSGRSRGRGRGRFSEETMKERKRKRSMRCVITVSKAIFNVTKSILNSRLLRSGFFCLILRRRRWVILQFQRGNNTPTNVLILSFSVETDEMCLATNILNVAFNFLNSSSIPIFYFRVFLLSWVVEVLLEQ